MFKSISVAIIFASMASGASAQVDLPESFDYMGPSVRTMEVSGRDVAYVDTGPAEGKPVLFIGGTGTSAAIIRQVDFLRTMREDLGLRLISVGRAGFGLSSPADGWTFDDYATDATAVLDKVGVEGEVTVIAVSGGGPYAAAFVAAHPDRIHSIHLASATSLATDSPLCDDAATLKQVMYDYAAHPMKWWAFPDSSPTHDIPGFGSAAADDGARTFSMGGQKGSGAAQVAEVRRYCDLDLPDVSGVDAPVYIYQGLKDTTVFPVNADRWEKLFSNVVERRNYEDGGHDIQYRHWDQILIDMAGMGDRIVICRGGTSQLVADEEATTALSEGARLGVCAWPE